MGTCLSQKTPQRCLHFSPMDLLSTVYCDIMWKCNNDVATFECFSINMTKRYFWTRSIGLDVTEKSTCFRDNVKPVLQNGSTHKMEMKCKSERGFKTPGLDFSILFEIRTISEVEYIHSFFWIYLSWNERDTFIVGGLRKTLMKTVAFINIVGTGVSTTSMNFQYQTRR